MDLANQRLYQQQNAVKMMYQNQGYQFERNDRKTFLVVVEDSSSSSALTNATEFSVDLFETMLIDKLSDVYLDNFSTFNGNICDKADNSMFVLGLDKLNIAPNTAGGPNRLQGKLLIPNENNDIGGIHSTVIHKSKKMNYVCSINPSRLSTVKGTISNTNGDSIFNNGRVYSQTVTGIDRSIPAGNTFTLTGGTGTGTVLFHHEAGATTLYFSVSSGGAPVQSSQTYTISPIDGSDNSVVTTVSTMRTGDYPRFIAEFVIIARE